MVEMTAWLRSRLSRRVLLAGGVAAAGGSAVGAAGALRAADGPAPPVTLDLCTVGSIPDHSAAHGAMITVGDVDYARNGFDPTAMLTDWETGSVSTLPDGRTLRTFEITAEDKEIEIAPGLMFPAWTYNGRVPGPTLARHRRRPPPHRFQELRLAPAFHAFSRHPRGPHGRRSRRRDGRSGRRVRLRIRCPPVRLPSLPLPRAAAETPPAQGHVWRLRHRPRSRPPSRACRHRPLAPARQRRRTGTGRNW